MTDLSLQGTSAFNADTSAFDSTSLDENLQSISAVERTWRAPALPDSVKLDLAALPGVNAQGLTGMLQGLDEDLNGGLDEEEDVQELPPIKIDRPLDPNWGRTTPERLKVEFADIIGEPAPTQRTEDANALFKKHAIERGYLERPPSGRVDNTWSPELNSIRWQMAQDEYNDRLRGDRTGAVPMSSLMRTLGDWTSPGGLLAAATELDMFWDFGAIDREISGWGDKWRKVGDSKNPFDFAKNLVDAITGPVDDIVIPIANWAILASGIGATGVVLKGATGVSKMGRGFATLNKIYTPTRQTQAGMIAGRLAKGGRASQEIAAGMKRWREFQVVSGTKAAVGSGMRLGATSQAQDLLPGYQGGLSLADTGVLGNYEDVPNDPNDPSKGTDRRYTSGVGSFLQTDTVEQPWYLPAELMLAPQNIFLPGTWIGRADPNGANLLGKAATTFLARGGTLPGRAVTGAFAGGLLGATLTEDGFLEGAAAGAAGGVVMPYAGRAGRVAVDMSNDAIGALKYGAINMIPGKSAMTKTRTPGKLARTLGFIADAAAHTNWKPLAEDQRVTNAFVQGFRRKLEMAGDAEKLQEFNANLAQGNALLAIQKAIGAADEKQTAGFMAYVMKSAGIDKAAKHLAGDGENFISQFHLFQNKLTAQTRIIDLEDTDPRTVLHRVASSYAAETATSPADVTKKYDYIIGKWTSDEVDDMGRDGFARMMDWVSAHNENAEKLTAQLLSPQILDLDSAAAVGRNAVGNQTEAEVLGTLEGYVTADMSFQSWNDFSLTLESIESLEGVGTLDYAKFVPARSWRAPEGGRGQEIGYKGWTPKDNPKARVVDEAYMDSILGPDYDGAKKFGGQHAPFARGSRGGRFTAMRAETAAAHTLVEKRRELKEIRKLQDMLVGMKGRKQDLGELDAFSRGLDGQGLTELDDAAIVAVMKRAGYSTKTSKSVKELRKTARQLGVDPADLADTLQRRMDNIIGDDEFWEAAGVNRFRNPGDEKLTGRELIDTRIKQLNKAIPYTASEVDVPELANYLRSVGRLDEAAELETTAAGLAERGYKLVHGVEFQMPSDLMSQAGHGFADLKVANMHAATMGNFFKGRLPAVARARYDLQQRAVVTKVWADRGLADLDPDGDQVRNIVADLQDVLTERQDSVVDAVRSARESGSWTRNLDYVKSSVTPMRIEDMPKQQVVNGMTARGWSTAEAEAAWLAAKQMRNSEFRDMGLYAFEAYMRKNSQLTQSLKIIGGTKGFSPMRTGAGALVGAGVGGAMTSDEESLGGRLVGGLVGAGVATGVATGARKAAEHTDLIRAGYLADGLVKARDTLRFTLSPFFDLSRYTEGLMLGQTATPLRRADGSRIVMPVDMSPKGLARQFRKEGKSPEAAMKAVEDGVAQFRAAARGDFDPHVLDEAGKWFSQVGILGFDPTRWMGTAYTRLVDAGLSSDEAYKAARNMYTYGTNGRSAAEMSVNYIFFPFSFQKKALTHLGDFLTDDLSRSIILHDMYKTYEILDEKYDLDEFWKDHVPALQALQRLNLFAFGISPGRFGGINAQAFESAGRGAASLGTQLYANSFQPQGVSIRDAADAAELQRLQRSVMPVLNDINWMTEAVKEQGHVLMSEEHLTTRAEISAGYREWDEYKSQVLTDLERAGYTLSDLFNKSWLAPQLRAYQMRKAEIGSKYSAWGKHRRETTGNRVALDMEKRDRIAAAAGGSDTVTQSDVQLYEMEQFLAYAKDQLGLIGVPVGGNEGWDNAPPELFNRVAQRAQSYLAENPAFMGVWEKYYRNDWGLLEARI